MQQTNIMQVPEIDARQLTSWLNSGKKVAVVDIGPAEDRSAGLIPGSIQTDVYEKIKARDTNAFAGLLPDRSVPVILVCGGGRTSILAAEILISDGYEAYSLPGGMAAWQQLQAEMI